MFTGLIEEIGEITAMSQSETGAIITIGAKTVLQQVALGDSIAIDGVCTTVVRFTPETFTIEASPETLSITTFRFYESGRRVNLERPLTPNARLGGHFVTGHVDSPAVVIGKEAAGNSWVFHFRLMDEALAPLLITKGSVAIDGISLTVNEVNRSVFSVAIIPHTWENTTVHQWTLDGLVNIETDLLGKYVQKLLPAQTSSADGRPSSNPHIPTLPAEPFGNSTIHSGAWFNLE